MQKIFALLMVSALVLAGCTEVTEDDVEDVIETIVPGCNDPAALNYDANADNGQACMTEAVLTSAITDFIEKIDEGPDAGETMGMSIEMTMEEEDLGSPINWDVTMAQSSAGFHMVQGISMEYVEFTSYVEEMYGEDVEAEMVEMMCEGNGATYTAATDVCSYSMTGSTWALPSDGGTTIYVDYLGEKFFMESAMSFEATQAAMVDDDDDESYGTLVPDATTPAMCEAEADKNNAYYDGEFEDAGYHDIEPGCYIVGGGDVYEFQHQGEETSEGDLMDPTSYDWSTANFSSSVAMQGTEVMFEFSTEMTVDGVTALVTVQIDQNLEIRSLNIVEDENNQMSVVSYTASEIDELMNIDASMFSEQEALPFTVGYGESFEMLSHDESVDNTVMMWECTLFTNESTPLSDWDLGTMDDSVCDTEVDHSETLIDQNYTGEILLPYAMNIDNEDGMQMLGEIHADYMVYVTMSGWSTSTDDTTGEVCEEELGGTYDATTDECYMEAGEIIGYDDMFIEMMTSEGDYELTYYQYDYTTESGIFADATTMWMCDDGEYIDEDWVNDGEEDCADGSDEWDDYGGDMYWDCEMFVELSLSMDDWDETNLDTSVCGELYTEPAIDSTYAGDVNLPEYWWMEDSGPMYWIDSTGSVSTVMMTYNNAGDPDGTYCLEMGHSYDEEEELCTETLGEIMEYDDQFMKVYSMEDGEDMYVYYDYDETTGSGILAGPSDGNDEWDGEITFICGNGDEIPFDWVNDGYEDCEDGADEQQYDTDGNPINWFDCEDGTQIWISEVNDGYPDCANGEDEAHDDDDGGYNFETFMVWECDLYIGESMWTTEGMDAWDDTNLDMEMCDQVIDPEFWYEFELSSEESTFPMSWYMMFDDDDGIIGLVQLAEDDDGNMMVHGHVNDWSTYYDEEYCEGDYDASDDVCTMTMGELLGSDEMFIVISEDGDETIVVYQYDASTGSGVFATGQEMYMCDSEDEYVDADWVNDGIEDCMDGSDEFEYEGDGIETNLWWDGEYLTWEVEYHDPDEFDYVEIMVYDYDDDLVLSYTEGGAPTYLEFSANTFTDGECYYGKATSYAADETFLTMSEEWFCVGSTGGGGDNYYYDYMVHAENSDMIVYAGDLSDYSAVLATCNYESDDDDDYEWVCTDTSVIVSLTDAMDDEGSQGVFFFDRDNSGTLTDGDYLTVSDDVEVEWDEIRLYSDSAQAYSDENPLSESVPGFTALLTVISLMGALLIRKNE